MHDLMNAARFCQKVMLLDDGGVLAHDTPEVVFDKTRLESVYEVKVSVEPSQCGFLNVIALEPVPDEHEHHH
jgi:ABC-type cobalamin/Fe3+-siderophores transport system ATPase subunit